MLAIGTFYKRFGTLKKVEKQLVVRHVKVHAAGETRKHMQDTINYDAHGNDKADELAKNGADQDTAFRPEWLASELQMEREKVGNTC